DDRRPSESVAAEAVSSRSAIRVASLREDARFSSAESVIAAGIETAIAAPLFCNGEAVAVLYADRLGLPIFEERDLRLLGIAANHVSTVLENEAYVADLRRARAELAEWNRSLEQKV